MRGLEMSDHEDDVPILEIFTAENGWLIIDNHGNRHVSLDTCDMHETLVEILKNFDKNWEKL
tara:strand:+ start:337 stop:522 length:186 start_codon:yes stop_codon:yes gene_type:complete